MHKRQLQMPGLFLAAFASLAYSQSVMVLTGPSGTGTTIGVFSAASLTPQVTILNVPPGAFLVLPKPDGSKYYVISNSGSTGVSAYDQNFSNGRVISGAIGIAPVTAALSPDGRRLAVIAGAGGVFVFDTATDTLIKGNINVAGIPGDVAFSVDSSTMFVLGNNGGVASVTPVDMSTLTPGAPLCPAGVGGLGACNSTGFADAITTAPNGFIYVSAQNHFYEINPRTVQVTPAGDIPISGFRVSKPIFTPDGKYAIVFNKGQANTAALAQIDLTSHVVSSTFPGNFGATIDRLIPAGNTRFYAYASQTSTIYDGSLTGGINLNQSALQGILPTNGVTSAVASLENPAKILYVAAFQNGQNVLYRIDLGANQATAQTALGSAPGQVVQFAGVNPTSGAAGMTAYNTSQTIAAGGVSLPLTVRVTDANGQGVIGARVDYATTTAGATFSSASAATNSEGYATSYLTAPTTAGVLTVSASSTGTPGAQWQINVTGGGTGPGGGGAAGLSILSGQGQLIAEQSVSQPLTVVVRDNNGVPQPNVNVTFTITQGNGTLTSGGSQTQVTDAQGQASVSFLGTSNAGQSYVTSVVNAASPVGSVNFFVTTYLVTLANGFGAAPPISLLLKPDPENSGPYFGLRVIRGGVGQVLPGAIQLQLVATAGNQAGQGIPNVALNVSGSGDPGAPFATCANQNGVPLTDANGVATCDVKLGNIITGNPAELNVNLGQALTSKGITIVTTVGPPGLVTITGGNNQTGRAGQALATQLRVRVTDVANNAVANVPVRWAVTQGSATLNPTTSTTDSNGNTGTTVTLGSTPGGVTITATAGTATGAPVATFTLTVSTTVGGVAVVSGNTQTAGIGTAFGQPLVVRVTDDRGAPLPNLAVTFGSSPSGGVTFSNAAPVTDANGQAQTTVTAGGTAGNVTVTATAGTQSTTFGLTVRLPGPPIGVASFSNAASGAAGLTPCGIATVSAPNLVPGVLGTLSSSDIIGPLQTTLGGADLTVNGIAAPLYWVNSSTVAFQTPCEVQPGTATVVMRVGGGSTTLTGVPVVAFQPGVFEYTDTTASPARRVAVLVRENGSVVSAANAARRGDKLKAFVTGLGPVSSRTSTGAFGVGAQTVDVPLVVGVNNAGVRLISAEYMAGQVGVYVVTFEVPADAQTGPAINFSVAASPAGGTATFSNGTSFPIAP